MKSLTLIAGLLLVTTLNLVGCADPASDAKKRMNEIADQSKKDAEEIGKKAQGAKDYMEMLAAQPGAISVSGIAVARQGNNFVLDHRISTKQTAGKLANGESAKIAEENVVKLSDTLPSDTEKTEATKKYFNVGCKDLTEADTAGLEQLTNDSNTDKKDAVASIIVDRVFICGEQKLSSAFLAITTQELILRDAHILNDKAVGNITLITQALKLNGENTIVSKVAEGEVNVHSSAPISLVVSQELSGQGTLEIATLGADAVTLKKEEQQKR